jgi:thiol-disulfide isomerase/thioredoxin
LKRRNAIATGVGALAAAAGIGAALWAGRGRESSANLWSLRFRRPGGGEIALAEFRGRPLLLNFWATWCVPCVTEMPLLARFHAEHRAAGWQVLGLAVDQEAPVRKFLLDHSIDFPIALADAEGLDLARALGNTAGGLPFSVALGRDGRVRTRKLGALDAQILANWAAAPG